VIDEAQQLAQIAAGDSLAFGRWVAGVELPLRLSLKSFAAVLDTEAVLQEALLRVWQVAPRFVPDGRPNALLRFAVTTTRNVAISELRRTPPPREALDALEYQLAADAQVSPMAPDPLLRAAIIECREKLPKQPKSALEQRLSSGGVDDDPVLAERVGMKLNTFLQNVTRARKLLAECLGKRGIDLNVELHP
jgi:DNA-directed RNA polymerase specialized sigma24 family protein